MKRLKRLLCRLRGHDVSSNIRADIWRNGVMVTISQTCFRCGATRREVRFIEMGKWT